VDRGPGADGPDAAPITPIPSRAAVLDLAYRAIERNLTPS
jgi:hypothetical protein